MSGFFSIEMLPAREGDCLWISYGDPADPNHILIDGGRKATARAVRAKIESLPEGNRHIELVVVTHVDRDHIEGMLAILDAGLWGASVGDVWFNGFHHLRPGLDAFGAVQGERLTDLIDGRRMPWNLAFGGGQIAIAEGEPRVLPTLPGGMRLTLLSPTPAKLEELRPVWVAECRNAGLIPGQRPRRERRPAGIESFGRPDIDALAATPFRGDHSEANGSSIALLAEYEGRRVLLGADAHADVLGPAVRALAASAPLRLDAFKVPHHGSAFNLSADLLESIDCRRFLVSTNGSYFDHPEPVAIARIIKFGGQSPELIFNYRTEHTERWDDASLRSAHGYEVSYPDADRDGFRTISL
jgi:hypothetical protein